MTPEPLSEQQIEEALRLARSFGDWYEHSIPRPHYTGREIKLARALLALQARLRESEQARDRALAELASAYPWSRAAAAEQEAGRLREALADFDHALKLWEEAYPTQVFGESLTKEESAQVVAALREAGFTSERVHASWARHVVGCLTESFAPVRAALAPEAQA